MKRLYLFLFASISFVLAVHGAVPSYTNPILPYDYSDPDVIRVGDTYLMTSSSFNNVPGLQILASKDLVHWEIVDAAIRYRLPGYKEGDKVAGNFVWAPAIREHEGRIWIYYGDPDRGIYCVRSKAISYQNSEISFPLEWEEPVLVMPAKGYIDPCPLWDEDGRVWLSHGVAGSRFGLKSVLMMAELTADGLAVKTPSRIIFDGHEEHPTSEGTKLYKRNGYYYIMHPAGGVATGWQVVQRSKNIYGPYELKVTLAQGKTSVNAPHQGGWVETPEGEGFFMHFQDVGVAGRIVHLQPLKWENDWPVMGNNGEPVLKYKGTKDDVQREHTWANFLRRDEFDSTELALDWQWSGGRVEPRWYFCDAANSRLRLYSAPREADEWMPNLLLQKIPAVAFTATARVRFAPNKHKKMVGAEQAGMIVTGRKASFRLEVPVTDEWVYLKLEMNNRQQGTFYTSTDGHKWAKAGEPFQAVEGHWIGAQVGFFCTRDSRTHNDAGWLDVDWFETRLASDEPMALAHELAQSEMNHHPELWKCDGMEKPKWEYTPTLLARAYLEMYNATGDTAYLGHAQRFADTFIETDGTIRTYKKEIYNMDRIQGGNFLILLNTINPQPQYVTAIETLRDQLREQPRTTEGGFWHKKVYAHQMWLDGLFTGTTFYARYAAWKPEAEAWSDIANQFIVADRHTRKANGLNHHGWDESKQMGWSDPKTGCSPETWGRAEGWYVMALCDVLEQMPANLPERAELEKILRRVADALMKVQDQETHLWYQVPDRAGEEGNYLESTCSAMFCYAMAKGARLGVLDSRYRAEAEKVLDGLKAHKIIRNEDGTLSLKDCCAVAGLGGNPYRDGTYTYYIHERIREDDPKGVAPLILACIELAK